MLKTDVDGSNEFGSVKKCTYCNFHSFYFALQLKGAKCGSPRLFIGFKNSNDIGTVIISTNKKQLFKLLRFAAGFYNISVWVLFDICNSRSKRLKFLGG